MWGRQCGFGPLQQFSSSEHQAGRVALDLDRMDLDVEPIEWEKDVSPSVGC
jgi:hypothetical protein